jgi:hypothetical protein
MASEAERRDWSMAEVEATVASYLDMLVLELQGLAYNKAERRRGLQQLLDHRSETAIERKHMNISAALIELGLPYVDGYKPLFNYQHLLLDAVRAHTLSNRPLLALVGTVVTEAPAVPEVESILSALVDRPAPRDRRAKDSTRERARSGYRARPTNYLEMEARNAALGQAGEAFVINFERARLLAARRDRLAAAVEHVALTRGDGEGFDVLSFASDGRERFIEVKTTSFGEYTPFFVTRNELEVSRIERERYEVCRVFAFRRGPRMFTLPGAIDENCDLKAAQYIASVG